MSTLCTLGLKSEVAVWYFFLYENHNNYLFVFFLILEIICTCFPLPKRENFCLFQITNCLRNVILFKEVRPKG